MDIQELRWGLPTDVKLQIVAAAMHMKVVNKKREAEIELGAKFKRALKLCPVLLEDTVELALYFPDRGVYERIKFQQSSSSGLLLVELPSSDGAREVWELPLRDCVYEWFTDYMNKSYLEADGLSINNNDSYAWHHVVTMVEWWLRGCRVLGLKDAFQWLKDAFQ